MTSKPMRSYFRPELKPPAREFYQRELSPRRLYRASRGWMRTSCPLHNGNNTSAFSVNLASGAFFCFNCNVSGGSVIDFLMLRDRVDFKAAAKAVGAWDESLTPAEAARVRREAKRRESERAIRNEQHRQATEARRECAAEIRLMERIIMSAGKRLDSVQTGSDAEREWQIMADAQESANRLYMLYDDLVMREDNFGGIHRTE